MARGPSDKDKTVIGGKLPTPEELRRLAGRPSGVDQPPVSGNRTVIGGGLPTPPGGPAPGRSAPKQEGFRTSPQAADAWMGGGNSPVGQASGSQDRSFFPTYDRPERNVVHSGPKIALHEALQATGLGRGGPSNPIVAAAANLLILFGRLRTQMVEMDAIPLMEHVTREIEAFHGNCVEAGVDPHEADVARYCLCGTADDIVQNIPGNDGDVWRQYSMVARFYNVRTSGVGFFEEVDKALQAPAQRFYLLELMLMCLSLGFEGKFRTSPTGDSELARYRAMIYESLRRVQPRPDEDVSVRWLPVELGKRKRFGASPFWVISSLAAALLLGVYLTLNMLISRDSTAVSSRLLEIHPEQIVGIQRAEAFTPYIPPEPEPSTQLEDIRSRLSERISDGSVEVDEKGDFIFVRVSNLVLFRSGSADVQADFAPIAAEVAEALNEEPGPLLVVGHTDGIPASGRGRYKTNQELSEARAKGVAGVLEASLSLPGRLIVEGRGPAEPIADNGTPEGRAENRRVEIMIYRKEALEAQASPEPSVADLVEQLK